ncbi:MAG: HAD family hydrolase [Rubrivivax sp.]
MSRTNPGVSADVKVGASPLRAVAWDVDGTLVDSEPLHLEALLEVCRAYEVDLSDFGPEPFVGVAAPQVWQALDHRFGSSLGHDAERRARVFLASIAEHFLARAHVLRPMPGAAEALRWLRKRDVPMCAVSNSPRDIVVANLRAIDATDCMQFIVSLDDVPAPKPHPSPYLEAACRLGLSPAEVWAVEDSHSGVASARAAGLRVMRVGPRPWIQGTAPHAHHHVESLTAAPALWQACLHPPEGVPVQ